MRTTSERGDPGRARGGSPLPPRPRRPRTGTVLLAVAGLVPLVGCGRVDDASILEVEAVGEVLGFVFIDLNGTGRPDPGDDGVEGWEVRLEQPGGGVLAREVTDTAGDFEFREVPAGRVVLRIDPALLGDTLELFGVALEPVTVAGSQTVVLQPGVTYPKRTVSEARAAPQGRPLFTTGVALNGLSQDVSVLHVADVQGDGAVIRVRDLVGDRVEVGDSVRVRGRVGRTAGQPVLELGEVFVLGRSGALLEPAPVSTATADGAGGGTLDGALVQIRDAEVVAVEDLDEGGVRLVVDDGSGELEVLLRAFLNQDPDDLTPGTVVLTRATGLLVPRSAAGVTRWTLQPRSRADYRIDETAPVPPPSVESAQRPVGGAPQVSALYQEPALGVKTFVSRHRAPGPEDGPGLAGT